MRSSRPCGRWAGTGGSASGAIASFPAREVIIATLGTIYSLGSDVEAGDQGLMDSLRNATRPDGTKVYNVPVALSIMVFFALCAHARGR